jgi:hypothetical protein
MFSAMRMYGFPSQTSPDSVPLNPGFDNQHFDGEIFSLTQCIANFLAFCSGERAPVSSIEMCCCPEEPEKSRTLLILLHGMEHLDPF